MHGDLTQQWQRGLEPVPDPDGQMLAGWILETRDLVEVVVVELVIQGLERGLEVGEVHHPASLHIEVSGDMDLNPE